MRVGSVLVSRDVFTAVTDHGGQEALNSDTLLQQQFHWKALEYYNLFSVSLRRMYLFT